MNNYGKEQKTLVITAILLVAVVCMRYPLRYVLYNNGSLNEPQFYVGYAIILIVAIILVIDFIIIGRKK